MAKSLQSLLDQIETGALDGATPLPDVLRKCVALGGRAGSSDLRDWARRELEGYDSAPEGSMPAYRHVRAALCIDGSDMVKLVREQQISHFELPEFAREKIPLDAPVPYGVAQLEEMRATSGSVRLQHPVMPSLVLYMNEQSGYGGATIHSLYWKVSTASILGILDTIRTNLVALVAEMRAVGTGDLPSGDAADQAINVVINGAKRSTITVNTNQSTSNGQPNTQSITSPEPPVQGSQLPTWIRGPWGLIIGLSTVAAGVAGVAVWAGWNPFS